MAEEQQLTPEQLATLQAQQAEPKEPGILDKIGDGISGTTDYIAGFGKQLLDIAGKRAAVGIAGEVVEFVGNGLDSLAASHAAPSASASQMAALAESSGVNLSSLGVRDPEAVTTVSDSKPVELASLNISAPVEASVTETVAPAAAPNMVESSQGMQV